MTTKHLGTLGLAAALGVIAAGTAFATPIEMTVTSGTGAGSSVSVPNSGGSSQIIYTNPDFNGWDVEIAFGSGHSPLLAPLGALDLSIQATNCLAATCAPLTIAISQNGYTQSAAPNGLLTSLSNTDQGDPSTLTQWAYLDTSNTYFGYTDSSMTPPPDFGGVNDPTTASLIGMLSQSGTGGTSVYGGNGAMGPYSLTLVDQVCSNPANADGSCSGDLSVSMDGGIKASEPGTLALFGAGLLGCALFLGRRRALKASRPEKL